MNALMKILEDEALTCVIQQDGMIYRETANGIRPILHQLKENHLAQAIVADKVIGKAAAMLFVYGKVSEIHTQLISEHARQYLQQKHIPFTFETCVPYIINRTKDGMCPMEATVLNCNDETIAYALLLKKLASM